jgi:Helix-turn-helix domain/DnaT DNA-binding domain
MSALDTLREVRDLHTSAAHKMVLTALVLRTNAEGEAWPSYERLSRDAGLSLAKTKRVVKELETAGHLSVRHGVRDGYTGWSDSNRYRVHVPAAFSEVAAAPVQSLVATEAPAEPIVVPVSDVPTTNVSRERTGSRLPEDWQPSAATIERFRRRERVDALGSLERFRNHWLAASGRNATKRDWDRALVNWVLDDIARGRAVKLPPAEWEPSASETPPSATQAREVERVIASLHKTRSTAALFALDDARRERERQTLLEQCDA